MTNLHDRQLEHDLNRLGQALSELAPAQPPDRLQASLVGKRRRIMVNRVALAAGLVLVSAGAVIVYLAASSWAPSSSRQQLADPRRTTPLPAPSTDTATPPAPQSIASLQSEWQRTGDLSINASPHDPERSFRAGDIADQARLKTASEPLR